jgi:hypothetical protein
MAQVIQRILETQIKKYHSITNCFSLVGKLLATKQFLFFQSPRFPTKQSPQTPQFVVKKKLSEFLLNRDRFNNQNSKRFQARVRHTQLWYFLPLIF